VTRWYVIAVAVLGAGCEQWKAPQRLHDLESRVDELATEVSALTGRPVGGKPKPEGKEGKGGKESKERKDGEHGDEDSPREAKSKAKSKAKPSSDHEAPTTGAKVEAREAGDHADDGKAEDGKPEETKEPKEDDAVARLKALVAKNTKTKPGESRKSEAPHWGYEGKFGPAQWGALDPAWNTCQAGTAQSPIDIEPKAGSASPITFRYHPTAAAVVDNGHTLQVNLAEGSSIEIDGQSYALVQFHFHTPSEHTIAGDHYPLEVHLVHKDASGKLAVVGVLYDAGPESKALDSVWAKWPRKLGVEEKLRKPFDPSELLPDTRTVFRYTGSLTTPPCTEGVVWNVMRRTLSDGKPYLDAFSRHYPRNARDIQALNDRKIE